MFTVYVAYMLDLSRELLVMVFFSPFEPNHRHGTVFAGSSEGFVWVPWCVRQGPVIVWLQVYGPRQNVLLAMEYA